MPDKQNENKLMAMLERRGIVRKTGSEDGSDETASGSDREHSEEELIAMFGSPTDNAIKVTPSARQPVPGMPNPVLPSERTQQANQDGFQPVSPMEQEQSQLSALTESERHKPAVYEKPTSPDSSDFVDASPYIDPVAPFEDDMFFDEEPFIPPPEPGMPEQPPQPPPPPPIESYTERYLSIDEIYQAVSLQTGGTNTVYLIEQYLGTLPASLPDESRREIVTKIIAASGFDFDHLLGDGILRVKMLKEYAERFARYTDDYISARHAELDELEQKMMRTRRLIENRRDLHKKQFFTIETEAQRLKDILTFVSG